MDLRIDELLRLLVEDQLVAVLELQGDLMVPGNGRKHRRGDLGVHVFPEGVEVLPWMLCGTNSIGEATAEKMQNARVVLWAMHGIYGAGKDLDETFGLVETVEKAAMIYMKIAHLPKVNTIQDSEMKELAEYFGVDYRKDYLDA